MTADKVNPNAGDGRQKAQLMTFLFRVTAHKEQAHTTEHQGNTTPPKTQTRTQMLLCIINTCGLFSVADQSGSGQSVGSVRFSTFIRLAICNTTVQHFKFPPCMSKNLNKPEPLDMVQSSRRKTSILCSNYINNLV